MLFRVNIRKGITCVLLLLFAFSNVPRKVLHDTFTHHIDGGVQSTRYASVEMQNSGLGCHCDDLYAQPVFDSTSFSFEASHFRPVADQNMSELPVVYCAEFYSFGLRGPPAFA